MSDTTSFCTTISNETYFTMATASTSAVTAPAVKEHVMTLASCKSTLSLDQLMSASLDARGRLRVPMGSSVGILESSVAGLPVPSGVSEPAARNGMARALWFLGCFPGPTARGPGLAAANWQAALDRPRISGYPARDSSKADIELALERMLRDISSATTAICHKQFLINVLTAMSNKKATLTAAGYKRYQQVLYEISVGVRNARDVLLLQVMRSAFPVIGAVVPSVELIENMMANAPSWSRSFTDHMRAPAREVEAFSVAGSDVEADEDVKANLVDEIKNNIKVSYPEVEESRILALTYGFMRSLWPDSEGNVQILRTSVSDAVRSEISTVLRLTQEVETLTAARNTLREAHQVCSTAKDDLFEQNGRLHMRIIDLEATIARQGVSLPWYVKWNPLKLFSASFWSFLW